MLFNSIHFFIFILIVVPIFFILPEKYQRLWIFLCSLYFYAVFQFIYVFLLLYSIGISYLSIYFITNLNQIKLKKLFLIIGIIGNLLLLLIFKYSVQLYDVLNFILGFEPCDKKYIQPPNILLPMGISFFCLQAISAIVDIYRGIAEKPKNILYFGLYLSFFPQLVAGPILRTKDLLDQFYIEKRFDSNNFRNGLFQICLGYLKKTLIADQISPYVDQIFQTPWEYHSISMWIAVYLFSLQIYGDFSGYSDIAIGIARIMGFELPQNFNRPFFSKTMAEFWRRWHISFSSWLRDYIYIPLGGSRINTFRTYINLFLTMLISGLWHGAGWNYLLWGALHGIFLLGERFLLSFKKIEQIGSKIPAFILSSIGIFYTYWVFSFTFFFFRAKPIVFPETNFTASSIEVAWYMVLRSIIPSPGKIVIPSLQYFVMIAILFFIEYLMENQNKKNYIKRFIQSDYLYVFAGVILFTCLVIYSVSVSQPFVYFQF
ncbi:MAG: membrane-bound O-acyltransferase family protein [Leptospiraceae bacterium]|nr:MAG: membrane-bound O-acyltransferase family protein [Leptospiraceae bacterium]